jgi:hypothetical protein
VFNKGGEMRKKVPCGCGEECHPPCPGYYWVDEKPKRRRKNMTKAKIVFIQKAKDIYEVKKLVGCTTYDIGDRIGKSEVDSLIASRAYAIEIVGK